MEPKHERPDDEQDKGLGGAGSAGTRSSVECRTGRLIAAFRWNEAGGLFRRVDWAADGRELVSRPTTNPRGSIILVLSSKAAMGNLSQRSNHESTIDVPDLSAGFNSVNLA